MEKLKLRRDIRLLKKCIKDKWERICNGTLDVSESKEICSLCEEYLITPRVAENGKCFGCPLWEAKDWCLDKNSTWGKLYTLLDNSSLTEHEKIKNQCQKMHDKLCNLLAEYEEKLKVIGD